MKSVIGSLLILGASMVQAANHVVVLGQNGALKFSPDSLVAAVGDTVEFQFAGGVFTLTWLVLTSRITPSVSPRSQHLACHSRVESGLASSSSQNPQQPVEVLRLQQLLQPRLPQDTRTWRNVKLPPSPHSPSQSTTPTHCGSTVPKLSTVKPVWLWLSMSMLL